jgi:hypothetical protein
MNIMKQPIARLSMLAALAFSSISMNSFSADLRGTVTTADGTPVCAMVLASGQYMFSCDYQGAFELNNLATEPDGTITLQVYADGFFPNVTSLSEFFPQTVIMQPANGSPTVETRVCETAPDKFYGNDSTTVVMRNGTELFNYNGSVYSDRYPYLIFQANNGTWYGIKSPLDRFGEKLQLDVTRGPDSCFTPTEKIGRITNKYSTGGVTYLEDENNDAIAVKYGDCDGVNVGDQVTVYGGSLSSDTQVVSLKTGASCAIEAELQ